MTLNDLLNKLKIDDFIVWLVRPEFSGTHQEIYDYRLMKGADRNKKLNKYLNYEVDSISEDTFDKQIFINIKEKKSNNRL